MFKYYFERIENVEIWPIISLVIFFVFFIMLLYHVFTADKGFINYMKHMPLEKDSDQEEDDQNK
ncbi:MAG: cytochrome C oxidase Cbb3 [Candidatus Cyclobacteriaceae bacterium M3_2C_046]